jgi:anti-anti-sigma factor
MAEQRGPVPEGADAGGGEPARRPGQVFEVEQEGATLVVTPLTDLREFEYQGIEAGGAGALSLLEGGAVKNVVLDFRRTDYYGSTALGFFVKLWRRVSGRGGRMAFCNLSAHEREVLRVTRLDSLWPICGSREEALKVVQG